MEPKRRSGRIVCELDVVLLGTDTAGKVIMEQTKTVVLSRHGAGIVSCYRFSPDDLLTLSLPDAAKEAEIRLVGQIGGEPGHYIYGIAFVDPDPHFWPMEFPEPESFESADAHMLLECSRCQARQTIEQHEIEEDVYSVNGYILRPCEQCGTSTPWKKAKAGPASTRTAAPPTLPRPNATVPAASFGSFEAGLADSLPSSSSGRSSYSGASTVSEFASLTETQAHETQTSTAVATATAVLQQPEPAALPSASRIGPLPTSSSNAVSRAVSTRELDVHGRPVNKRQYLRIRVNFSACVRHRAHADEVVECENVSKGGACFHSLLQYPLDSTIEIAAPFSPGETALFVPAKVKRIEELSGGLVFRYGVEYVKA
jgi:hypothetical protein